MFHGTLLEFEKEKDLPDITAVAQRTWELGDFIVNALGIKTWPGRYNASVAFHRSCHTRGTPSSEATQTLLSSIESLRLVAFGEGEQCCGFGGTFSVSFPNVSSGMGTLKLDHIRSANPDVLVSGDMSCMMHLGGLAEKQGKPIKTQHLAQVLRDALKNGGLLSANEAKS